MRELDPILTISTPFRLPLPTPNRINSFNPFIVRFLIFFKAFEPISTFFTFSNRLKSNSLNSLQLFPTTFKPLITPGIEINRSDESIDTFHSTTLLSSIENLIIIHSFHSHFLVFFKLSSSILTFCNIPNRFAVTFTT